VSILTFEEALGVSSLRTFRALVSMPVFIRRVRLTRSIRAGGDGVHIYKYGCGRRGGIDGFKVGLHPHRPSIIISMSFTALWLSLTDPSPIQSLPYYDHSLQYNVIQSSLWLAVYLISLTLLADRTPRYTAPRLPCMTFDNHE
jgi:hypothetical protein